MKLYGDAFPCGFIWLFSPHCTSRNAEVEFNDNSRNSQQRQPSSDHTARSEESAWFHPLHNSRGLRSLWSSAVRTRCNRSGSGLRNRSSRAQASHRRDRRPPCEDAEPREITFTPQFQGVAAVPTAESPDGRHSYVISLIESSSDPSISPQPRKQQALVLLRM